MPVHRDFVVSCPCRAERQWCTVAARRHLGDTVLRRFVDPHPDQREAQLEAARQTLRDASADAERLEWACHVLLALSRDPLERMLAERLRNDPER